MMLKNIIYLMIFFIPHTQTYTTLYIIYHRAIFLYTPIENDVTKAESRNTVLATQLANIQPQLTSLETKLSKVTTQLSTETQRRITAEMKSEEAENKLRESEGTLGAVRSSAVKKMKEENGLGEN